MRVIIKHVGAQWLIHVAGYGPYYTHEVSVDGDRIDRELIVVADAIKVELHPTHTYVYTAAYYLQEIASAATEEV